MKRQTIAIVAACAVLSFAAGNKCNYDKAILNFEKRMDMVGTMKGAKVSKELATEPDESSRIQKYSKPIKTGQYMGLRQYAVYGFIGCNLHMVRIGKINPKTNATAAEATVYMRDDGSMKASCKGKGRVLRVNVLNSSMRLGNYELEPNPECICYNSNNLERKPGKKTGCAEEDDFDGKAVTLSDDYVDFANPEVKKEDSKKKKLVEIDLGATSISNSDEGKRKIKDILDFADSKLEALSRMAEGKVTDGIFGKVTFFLTISPDGTIQNSRVLYNSINDKELLKGFVNEVESWNFGKSDGGESMVYLTFSIDEPELQ